MPDPLQLLLRGATVVLPTGPTSLDVGVHDGRIAALGDLGSSLAAETIDLTGLHLLPGLIDTQVHFREPGAEAKEDLETGTRAALLGGVTSICEMPNTDPPTTTADALADKFDRASHRAWCDHAFFIGATRENANELARLERLPGVCGVKVFMGSSTGDLLVDDDATLTRILENGTRRVAVHAEDEARLIERRALAIEGASPEFHPVWRDEETSRLGVERLLRLAKRAARPVHVLHVTTAAEMMLLAEHRDLATVEVTPQHLTLAAPGCYESLGTRAQMNPPIREAAHRDALWAALAGGLVDAIGSDHAPHTLAEKARSYPSSPSGMPGVQTLLPILLEHRNAGRLSLETIVELTGAGPARIYGIAGKGRIALGYDADLTAVDLQRCETLSDEAMASRCGWTPFAGRKVHGWPILTIAAGRVAMREGEILGRPMGRPLRFLDCLPTSGEADA